MKNATTIQLIESKEFIASCANFAKECGITPQDWNANKGHFIGLILAMGKIHGHI